MLSKQFAQRSLSYLSNPSLFPWEGQENECMQFQKSIVLKTVWFSCFTLLYLNSQRKGMIRHYLCMITLLKKYLKLINDAPLKKAMDLLLIWLLEVFFVPEKPGAFLGGVAEKKLLYYIARSIPTFLPSGR